MKRYEHVVAKPYLCVAALLEMILKAESLNRLSQDEIAEYLGVNVPPNLERAPVTNATRTDDSNKWGIITGSGRINEFFKEFQLPLTEHYSSIKLFQDWMFEDELESTAKQEGHVICGYDYGFLVPERNNSAHIGHVSIILGISDPGGEREVTFYDPGPFDPGIKTIKCYDLFGAIHAKNDGIWKIERT